MTKEDEDTLVVKFVLCGGYMWYSKAAPIAAPIAAVYSWYAIEPGKNESHACNFGKAATPVEAVADYIERYGAPWLKS